MLRLGTTSLTLPAHLAGARVVEAKEPPALPAPEEALRSALDRPQAGPTLAAFVEPGDRVAVIVPDETRAAALEVCLPAVAEAVRATGGQLVVRVANGSHRRASQPFLAQLARLAGADAGDRDWRDADAHAPIGRLEDGTLASLDRAVVEADRVVLIGATSFHYLAGFGGGGKLLAPGCADRATIHAIHAACLATPGPGRHPRARAGVLAGNPLQAQIEQVARLAPPALLLQVALQRGRRIAAVFAGELRATHAAASAFHARWGRVDAGRAAGAVIVSAGGAPYDGSLYQAHKALEAAAHLARAGGRVVLLAACPEGVGAAALEAAAQIPAVEALEAALRRDFSVAGHTALALRRKCAALDVVLVGAALPEALLRGLGLRSAGSLAEATAGLDPADVAVLPEGARVLPSAEGALFAAEAASL